MFYHTMDVDIGAQDVYRKLSKVLLPKDGWEFHPFHTNPNISYKHSYALYGEFVNFRRKQDIRIDGGTTDKQVEIEEERPARFAESVKANINNLYDGFFNPKRA